jgi:cytochrome c oxidase subunit IV
MYSEDKQGIKVKKIYARFLLHKKEIIYGMLFILSDLIVINYLVKLFNNQSLTSFDLAIFSISLSIGFISYIKFYYLLESNVKK